MWPPQPLQLLQPWHFAYFVAMKWIVQVQDALCMPFQHALIMSVSYPQQYITNQSLMPNHVNTNSYVVCTSCPKTSKTYTGQPDLSTLPALMDSHIFWSIHQCYLEFMCLYSVIIDLNMLCCTWKLEQPKDRCFPYLIQWCFMYCMSMYLCRWLSVTNVVAWQSAPVDARLSAWTLLLTLKLLVNIKWTCEGTDVYEFEKHRKPTSKWKVLTHCGVFVYSMITCMFAPIKSVHVCHHDLP